MGRLEGKVAIVTGGGRGIGAGIAGVLAREGASIAIADIDLENAANTAGELRGRGTKAEAILCDVTDTASAQAAARSAISALGHVDILVNNAGVVGSHVAGSLITLEDWDACYQVNLKGIWVMTQAIRTSKGAAAGRS